MSENLLPNKINRSKEVVFALSLYDLFEHPVIDGQSMSDTSNGFRINTIRAAADNENRYKTIFRALCEMPYSDDYVARRVVNDHGLIVGQVKGEVGNEVLSIYDDKDYSVIIAYIGTFESTLVNSYPIYNEDGELQSVYSSISTTQTNNDLTVETVHCLFEHLDAKSAWEAADSSCIGQRLKIPGRRLSANGDYEVTTEVLAPYGMTHCSKTTVIWDGHNRKAFRQVKVMERGYPIYEINASPMFSSVQGCMITDRSGKVVFLQVDELVKLTSQELINLLDDSSSTTN